MGEKFLGSIQNCIVITCCCSIGVFILGIARLSGQLFVSCMERYNVGRKEASFPFALCYTIRNVSGPLAAYLGQKLGAEEVILVGCVLSVVGVGACFFAEDIITVIVFWGCLYGLGFGLGSIPVDVILRSYFSRHYDKAYGIYAGSASISALLLPIITDSLLNTYGTSGTFLVLSGMMLHCIATSIILRNCKRRRVLSEAQFVPAAIENPTDSNQTAQNKRQSTTVVKNTKEISKVSNKDLSSQKLEIKSEVYQDPKYFGTEEETIIISSEAENALKNDKRILLKMLQMFLDPTFIIISITQCFTIFAFSVVWTVVVDYSRDVGVSTDQEVSVFMALTVGDIVGRLALGYITDAGYISKKNFTALCYLSLGVSIWSLSVSHGFLLTMASVCAVGLFNGGEFMIGSGITVLYIERDKLLLAFGCKLFLYPIFGFAQPYLIAYSRDVLGSYNGLFYFLAVINVFCGLLIMLLPLTTRLREKRKQVLENS